MLPPHWPGGWTAAEEGKAFPGHLSQMVDWMGQGGGSWGWSWAAGTDLTESNNQGARKACGGKAGRMIKSTQSPPAMCQVEIAYLDMAFFKPVLWITAKTDVRFTNNKSVLGVYPSESQQDPT